MNEDLAEVFAVTNLLLFLTEVRMANEYARQPNGQAALRTFAADLDDRIRNRARPAPGDPQDEQMLELQARMLTHLQRLAARVESRRAELRTLLTGGQG